MIYADWRALVNTIRGIRSSPGRAVMWLLFIGMVVFSIFIRAVGSTRIHVPNTFSDRVRADEVLGSVAALLLLTLAVGKSSFGVFRSRIEARLVIGSPVSPARAIAYLVARDAIVLSGRFAVSIGYVLFLTIPRSVGALPFALDLALLLVFGIAVTIALVPRRLLHGLPAAACAVVVAGLGLLAALPALRGLAIQLLPRTQVAAFFVTRVPEWHPGIILLRPNLGWLAATIGLAALAVGVLVAMTRDAYPELYALSTGAIDLRDNLSGKRGFAARIEALRASRATSLGPVTSTTNAPAGILIFVWRSFVEFLRRTQPRVRVLDAAFWAVCGYAFARFTRAEETFVVASVAGAGLSSLVVFSTATSTAVALELRRPIFWLSSAWLTERFGGLALGQLWPQVARSLIAAFGCAIGGAAANYTETIAIGLPALLTLVLGTGYALFALFPSTVDQRGPLAIVRIFVTYFLLVPPLAFLIVVDFMLGLQLVGLVGFAILAVLEGGGLVAFAAWRLDGRIDRLVAA